MRISGIERSVKGECAKSVSVSMRISFSFMWRWSLVVAEEVGRVKGPVAMVRIVWVEKRLLEAGRRGDLGVN